MKKYTLMAVLTASTLVWNCKPNEISVENEVKPKLSGARIATQSVPVKQWDATFGGKGDAQGTSSLTGNDLLKTAVAMADGGVILGGTSNSTRSGNKTSMNWGGNDYWLVNLDKNGTLRGMQTVGSGGDDHLSSILLTNDGGYLLGGFSNSPKSTPDPLGIAIPYKSQDSQGNDFWIVKLKANGAKVWDVTIGGTGNDALAAMVATSDGGYLLGGDSDSPIGGSKTQNSFGGYDFWVVKLDANGNKLWDKSYGTTNDESLQSIVPTPDGGYLLAGQTGTYCNTPNMLYFGNDYWVVKIDANGNKQWEKTLGTSDNDQLVSAVSSSDGGFLLGGYTWASVDGDKSQPSRGQDDYWIIKVDSRGNKVWDKTIGSSGREFLSSLAATPDGGFLIGGSSGALNSGVIDGDKTDASKGYGTDYWVVKINAQGTILWDKTAGGSYTDNLEKVLIMADGGILAAGSSLSPADGDKSAGCYGNYDYWAIKLK